MTCKKSIYNDSEEYYQCDHYGDLWFDGHCSDRECEFYE